jgi:hypothetical protein
MTNFGVHFIALILALTTEAEILDGIQFEDRRTMQVLNMLRTKPKLSHVLVSKSARKFFDDRSIFDIRLIQILYAEALHPLQLGASDLLVLLRGLCEVVNVHHFPHFFQRRSIWRSETSFCSRFCSRFQPRSAAKFVERRSWLLTH